MLFVCRVSDTTICYWIESWCVLSLVISWIFSILMASYWSIVQHISWGLVSFPSSSFENQFVISSFISFEVIKLLRLGVASYITRRQCLTKNPVFSDSYTLLLSSFMVQEGTMKANTRREMTSSPTLLWCPWNAHSDSQW